MAMIQSELSAFEMSVLEKLLAGRHPVLDVLRRQLRACCVDDRQGTGHGFYTSLSVDPSVEPAPLAARTHIGDVGAEISGLRHGAGLVLLVTAGYLDLLEGFSYEEPWPEKVGDFTLFYEGDRAGNPAAIVFPRSST